MPDRAVGDPQRCRRGSGDGAKMTARELVERGNLTGGRSDADLRSIEDTAVIELLLTRPEGKGER